MPLNSNSFVGSGGASGGALPWYPYFCIGSSLEPVKVTKGLGSKLYLADGRVLVDGISSWWSVAHGYLHPYVLEKMQRQLADMPAVMFGGIVHQPAIELSEKLGEFAGGNFSRVFFSDSGSVAVEVAVKMALQRMCNTQGSVSGSVRNPPHMIHFENSYHGDTLGAGVLSHAMHSDGFAFDGYANCRTVCLPVPSSPEKKNAFCKYLDENCGMIAGCILEPLLQCAGGFVQHSSDALRFVLKTCKKYGVTSIVDECATGFYRTGSRFAFWSAVDGEEADCVSPDIMVLGKALTAGFIGMAATLASEEVFQEVCQTPFLHGPTFMANPLACSAAIASVELFTQNEAEYTSNVTYIARRFEELAREAGAVGSAAGVEYFPRVLGCTIAVSLPQGLGESIKREVALSPQSRAWLRPMGGALYLAPSINISADDLDVLCEEFIRYL